MGGPGEIGPGSRSGAREAGSGMSWPSACLIWRRNEADAAGVENGPHVFPKRLIPGWNRKRLLVCRRFPIPSPPSVPPPALRLPAASPSESGSGGSAPRRELLTLRRLAPGVSLRRSFIWSECRRGGQSFFLPRFNRFHHLVQVSFKPLGVFGFVSGIQPMRNRGCHLQPA